MVPLFLFPKLLLYTFHIHKRHQEFLTMGVALISSISGGLANPIQQNGEPHESGGNTVGGIAALGSAILGGTISKALKDPPRCYSGFEP